MAQFGSALDWGSRGRRFKSCSPDHVIPGRRLVVSDFFVFSPPFLAAATETATENATLNPQKRKKGEKKWQFRSFGSELGLENQSFSGSFKIIFIHFWRDYCMPFESTRTLGVSTLGLPLGLRGTDFAQAWRRPLLLPLSFPDCALAAWQAPRANHQAGCR